MKVALATAILLISHAPLAQAGFQTGNQLLSDCTASEKDSTYYQLRANCRAYVIGATDMLQIMNEIRRSSTPPQAPSFCLPDRVTQGQITDVATDYLNSNAKLRHLPAAWLVWNSLIQAFPC
jgi:hypothetical protein